MNRFDDLLVYLKQRLKKDLPGFKAHKYLLPEGREYLTYKKGAKNAAVLILLYPENDNISFVLLKRTKDNSPHSGQISLPGGQQETGENLEDTALRETFEEIGVKLFEKNILGSLSSLHIPVSNFNVFPFVGFIEYKPIFKINFDEVQKIYEITLEQFLYFQILKKNFFILNRGEKIKAPAFVMKNEYIWGATAMILNEFRTILPIKFN